ncbi:transporter substrate-binding domain-containing protein [Chitiniphilus purpureus]|uniref:Transporter substrate-binding domain-containing protein n=1 Tax=Chitiniphilus purpureus TaxID=2981137 RepID=A0ABY6DSB7_9NEIS|nr:transporter substrate-binding domain-containing protein [Chitiniphilus sp. CD1]UXY17227.1 transporter substrate-binding domain-containing protein [Chitiniphilus sp. CD1]
MRHLLLAALVALAGLAHADDLTDIKKKGEILIGVKDSSPPFSQLDPKTRLLRGYDIEFAQGIARRLGVKPVFITVESDDRIPALKKRQVDLVVADLTRTRDREKEIDFSVAYFVTEDKVLGKKGRFKQESDLNAARLGATATSSTAKMLRKDFPQAKLVEFEDKPEIVKALVTGQIDGAVADGPVLASFQARLPANVRGQYEVSSFALSIKTIAVGLRKGEKELQAAVNAALVDMETSGDALKSFDRWFGSGSTEPMMRIFTISSFRTQ